MTLSTLYFLDLPDCAQNKYLLLLIELDARKWQGSAGVSKCTFKKVTILKSCMRDIFEHSMSYIRFEPNLLLIYLYCISCKHFIHLQK